jgi:hypothetical protein
VSVLRFFSFRHTCLYTSYMFLKYFLCVFENKCFSRPLGARNPMKSMLI